MVIRFGQRDVTLFFFFARYRRRRIAPCEVPGVFNDDPETSIEVIFYIVRRSR